MENYRAEFVNNRIIKRTTASKLPYDTNLLIQAIRDVTIFHYMLRPVVSKFKFKEDIYSFFSSRGVSVTMDYKVPGKIKSEHSIDIKLNGRKESLLSKTISVKNSSQLQSQLERVWFTFADIKASGEKYASAIFYDDTSKEKVGALKGSHIKQIERSEIPIFLYKKDNARLEHLVENYNNL